MDVNACFWYWTVLILYFKTEKVCCLMTLETYWLCSEKCIFLKNCLYTWLQESRPVRSLGSKPQEQCTKVCRTLLNLQELLLFLPPFEHIFGGVNIHEKLWNLVLTWSRVTSFKWWGTNTHDQQTAPPAKLRKFSLSSCFTYSYENWYTCNRSRFTKKSHRLIVKSQQEVHHLEKYGRFFKQF